MYAHIDDFKFPKIMIDKKENIDSKIVQHYHDACELSFFVQVELELSVKGTKYNIKNGDIIFINEFDLHSSVYANENAAYTRYTIHFQKDYLLPILKLSGIEWIIDFLNECRYTHTPTSLKERNEVETLFKAMLHAYNSSSYLSEECKDAVLKSHLLLILIRFCELLKKNAPELKMTKQENFINEILNFIDENYMAKISLDLIEEKFFLDKYHICHLFREITGFSIIEYLNERRIIEAQKMLRDTKKEIIDICFDCGFNNIQHFHKIFKKISGYTPDKYRKLKI